MFGTRYVNLGGTVLVGEGEALELNSISTRLMHA
jgi:hypothetical protein